MRLGQTTDTVFARAQYMMLFQKVANHLALIYPGARYFPDTYLYRVDDFVYRQGRSSAQQGQVLAGKLESTRHRPRIADSSTAQDVEWVKAAFPSDFHRRKRTVDTAFDDELCGKWDILCQLLDVWKENGDKVLIFSMSLNSELRHECYELSTMLMYSLRSTRPSAREVCGKGRLRVRSIGW